MLGYNPLLDLRADVRREAQLAITSRRLIVTGPLELVQGGRGLILRQAVYRGTTYWGLVSIVVDLAPLLQEAQFSDDTANCSVLLRSADGTQIDSSSQPVDRDPVQQSIVLPDGSWELSMTPAAGWDAALSGELRLAWLVIAGFALLAMALAYVLSNRHDLLREAVRQRTRDLHQLNRRLQTDIVRRQRTEAALRESEERYRLIAENSTDLIAIFNSGPSAQADGPPTPHC